MNSPLNAKMEFTGDELLSHVLKEHLLRFILPVQLNSSDRSSLRFHFSLEVSWQGQENLFIFSLSPWTQHNALHCIAMFQQSLWIPSCYSTIATECISCNFVGAYPRPQMSLFDSTFFCICCIWALLHCFAFVAFGLCCCDYIWRSNQTLMSKHEQNLNRCWSVITVNSVRRKQS